MLKKYLLLAGLGVAATTLVACTQGGLSQSDVEKLIDDKLQGEQFNERVATGIEAFIAKQEQEAQAQQQAAQETAAQARAEAMSNLSEADLIGDDPVKGSLDASVTILEFSDFGCSFCARHHTQTTPSIVEQYVESGQVKIVYKDFALRAMPAAVAANCAREQGDDNTYFAFQDLLFENFGSYDEATLVEYANQLELDQSQFEACIADESKTAEIEEDLAFGQQIGVQGTPAFLVGDEFIEGAYPFEAFQEAIEAELAK